jgi:hypothetical protein
MDIKGLEAGRALAGQALVSDQAAARLAPSGFDPSRKQRKAKARYQDFLRYDSSLSFIEYCRMKDAKERYL